MYHRGPMSATILIVEDEYAVARGIQYALQQEGYQVTVVGSGEEALESRPTSLPISSSWMCACPG